MADKILFISDTSDGQNWGCHATSNILRERLSRSATIQKTLFLSDIHDKNLSLTIPNISEIKYMINYYSKIKSLDSHQNTFFNYAIPIVDMFDYFPLSVTQFERKANEFLNSRLATKFFGSISDIDHVIINGEGSIHGDRRKSKVLLFLAYLGKIVYNVDTHIINHTLAIDDPCLKSMVEMVYPELDTIIFREPVSLTHYLKQVGEGNVILSADAAWYINNMKSAQELNRLYKYDGIDIWYPRVQTNQKLDFSRPYITVGGGSGFQRYTETVKSNFIDVIELIDNKNPNIEIMLTAAAQRDEGMMLEIAENTGHPLIKHNNSYNVAASVIANSEVYLGGRWHASIFALLGGARLVNFNGNTFKIAAIKEQFELSHPIYSCENIGYQITEIASSVSERIKSKPKGDEISEAQISEMKSLIDNGINHIFK